MTEIKYGGQSELPLKVYHGVPAGWTKEETIHRFRNLNGKFDINGPRVTEPGSPSFLPGRENWLQYKATLSRICDGIKVNDKACIEIATQYIELRYIGSYSGYLRQKMARLLKNAELTDNQRDRLIRHIEALIAKKEFTNEFKEYSKLYKKITGKDL